jgi:hypothetical protein
MVTWSSPNMPSVVMLEAARSYNSFGVVRREDRCESGYPQVVEMLPG